MEAASFHTIFEGEHEMKQGSYGKIGQDKVCACFLANNFMVWDFFVLYFFPLKKTEEVLYGKLLKEH